MNKVVKSRAPLRLGFAGVEQMFHPTPKPLEAVSLMLLSTDMLIR